MQYLAYPHYQKTNIDWLGDIPEHWGYRKLRYYSKQVATGTIPTGDIYFEDATENWFTPSDFDDRKLELNNSNRKINITAIENGEVKVFPAGSVLVIGIGATLGKIGMSKTNFSCNQQINIIIPDDILDARFLAYSLQVKIEVMKIISNSTTIGIMNQDKTKLIDICAPHLDEQEKIALFLDYKTRQIDQLIEKKKALIEKLVEQRIAVITQAVTKGIDENAKLKSSGVDWLGDVPEHWGLRRLKFLSNESLQYGANEAAEMDDRDQPRFIRITDVKADGTLHDETFRSIPEDIAEPFILSEGDILMARSGATVGKTFIYSDDWGVAAYAGYLIRFRVDLELMEPNFAYLFFQTSTFWANINSTLIQSTIQNFSAEKYANILMPVPPKDEQEIILTNTSHLLRKLDGMVKKAQEAIEKLEEYRSAIITSAVTGKIDVREIEIPEVNL